MNLGIKQNNSLLGLTMDVWEDKVYFEGRAYEAGHFAAEVMNRSKEQNTKLLLQGGGVVQCIKAILEGWWRVDMESTMRE